MRMQKLSNLMIPTFAFCVIAFTLETQPARAVEEEPEIGLPENYYEFKWGDAKFIVLDPFRHTTTRNRGEGSGGSWYWTLGEHQSQ